MKRVKVTIIEDEDAHLELMERTIKREFPDAYIDRFKEIERCLDSVDQINPDIIITDYLLPGMNGLEFLEELQKRNKKIPVVVVTGQGDENIAVKAMKLGAYDYIVKSADFFSLVPSIIQKVIRRKELKRALQESQALYEQERNKLNSILASMVNPLAAINPDMTIDFVNPVFEKTFGKGLIGKPCQIIFSKSCDVNAQCQKAIKNRQIHHREFEDINGRIWHVTVSPVIEYNGDMITAVLVFQDITERKQAEKTIRESEERYRTLFETAAEGILVADIETMEFRYANPSLCRMLGYTGEELKRMNVRDLHPKDALQHVISEFTAQARGEKTLAPNIPCLRKDGTTIYADVNTAKVLIDGRECNVGFLTDITERKFYEERLRHLSERMINLQEEERSRISRELHDELGQVLTALKFDAAWLKRYLPDGKVTVTKRFQEMCDLIDGSLNAVRRISTDLRPGILDDMGLGAAIEWHASEFGRRLGIECVTLIDLPKKRLAGHLETGVYRIIQEALTNVARHAKASMVTISIKQNNETLFVQVQDNGAGIELTKIQSPLSTGISSMRERAEILSGAIEIQGQSGKGTEINVQIPLTYR